MIHQLNAETTATEAASLFADQVRGKTILTSGVTPGSLGFTFLTAIAAHDPHLLILAGRNLTRLRAAESALKSDHPTVATRLLELDLSSLVKAHEAARQVNAWPEPVDVLVNNAANMAGPFARTQDGIEAQFGVNYLAPWLFTNLIMSRILVAGREKGARVVSVSSRAHWRGPIPFDDLDFDNGKAYDKLAAYGQSKTANILFSVSLAEKLGAKGVSSYSLHPGVIRTLWAEGASDEDKHMVGWIDENGESTGVKFKALDQGAATHVVAAFDPSIAGQNGAFLMDCQVDRAAVAPHAVDKGTAERLWKFSEKLVGEEFQY